MSENILQTQDLILGYGRTTVVRQANIEVPKGGITAILGHNGAGKTTLLRGIVGLLKTQGGRIDFGGKNITKTASYARVRQGIGYVPQGQQSFGQLTTLENLKVVADRFSDGKERIGRMLELFPALAEFSGRKAGLLSGGQRQQLAIARALITRPKLLIFDEPTEGIQPSIVQQIEQTIMDIVASENISVLLVEQHVGFALAVANNYYVLASGRITKSGSGGIGQQSEVKQALSI